MNLLLLAIVLVAAGQLHAQKTNFKMNEKQFEKKFHIKYLNKDEEKRAAKELAKEEKLINEHNEEFKHGKTLFYDKLYKFSDLPKDVFAKEKLGLKLPHGRGLVMPPESERYTDSWLTEFYETKDRQQLPAEYDATLLGLTTEVKSQGSCGSCAAFAGTGALESCLLKAGANVDGLDVSEQHILDCGYNGDSMNACNGAAPGEYLVWLNSTGGNMLHELNYPYQDANPAKKCPTDQTPFSFGAKVTEVYRDFQCDEEKMMKLLHEFGVVESVMNADNPDGKNFAGGIVTCKSQQIDHAIVVVGYGTSNGVPYWKVRNSWGSGWGENGYMRVKRGTKECGIGSVCTVAKCQKTDIPLSKIPEPPKAATCKIAAEIEDGTYSFRNIVKGKPIDADVSCVNSVCTPTQPGIDNACMFICGKTSC